MKKPKVFRTKKALLGDVAFWIIRLLVLTFSIIALITMKNSAINKLTSTHDLEYKILTERIINSPTAFAFVDSELNRAYPGIIDLTKFNQQQLNNSLKSRYPIALKLVLTGERAISKDKTEQINEEIYYDKDKYDYLLPLTIFEGYKRINDTRLVVIYDKGKRIPGFLYIEVIAG